METCFLALLAELHCLANQPALGLSVIDEAMKMEEEAEEYIFHAELHRLAGELSLLQGADSEEAEEWFREALVVARDSEVRLFELRAAVSLGRLLTREGRPDEARRILRETYDWFTEGFDTADLRAAKALLDELR